jgi:hypothetical protein
MSALGFVESVSISIITLFIFLCDVLDWIAIDMFMAYFAYPNAGKQKLIFVYWV